MESQQMLKDFATQVSIAIEGETVPVWFQTRVGLCTNLANYMDSKRLDYSDRESLLADFNAKIELHREYAQYQYPFNLDVHEYLYSLREELVYKNQYRLAFIEVLKNGS